MLVRLVCRINPVQITKFRLQNLNTTPQDPLKDMILEKSLSYVNQFGWKSECITQAVKDLKLPIVSHGIIERGPIEVLEYFLHKKRQFVLEKMKSYSNPETLESESKSINEEKLIAAIELHFKFTLPYLTLWPSALALLSEPHQVARSLELLNDLIDDLCMIANIKSSRMDWYTERVLLTGLYTTSEFYLLTDYSEDMLDTRKFIKQNVQNYVNIRSATKSTDNLYSSISKIIFKT